MCTQPKEVIPELIFLLLSKIGSTEKGRYMTAIGAGWY